MRLQFFPIFFACVCVCVCFCIEESWIVGTVFAPNKFRTRAGVLFLFLRMLHAALSFAFHIVF